MCGIAGIMTADGSAPEQAALDAMQTALRHRGPDGAGRHLGDGIGLVHTRLAIIDLETGDQPIISPDGTALIANAEIYNYLELRETLADAPLRTQSDCEPALYLYIRDGIDFANQLRGMYAIAIHDPGEGQLLLARDPFGIKPIYYVEGSFGFAFASEPTALIKAGLVAPGLVAQPLHEMLQMQFTTGRESIHANIHRVLPGETLVIAQGRIVDRRRRAALPLQRRDERPHRFADIGVDGDIGDGAAVFAFLKIPGRARAEHQRVLAAKGDGVYFADAAGLD